MQVIDDIFNIVGINVPAKDRAAPLQPAIMTKAWGNTSHAQLEGQRNLSEIIEQDKHSPTPRPRDCDDADVAAFSVPRRQDPATHSAPPSKSHKKKHSRKSRHSHDDFDDDDFSDMDTVSRNSTPSISPVFQNAVAERAHRRDAENGAPLPVQILKKASSWPAPRRIQTAPAPKSIMKPTWNWDEGTPPLIRSASAPDAPPAFSRSTSDSTETKPKISKMKQLKKWFSRSAGSKKEMIAVVQATLHESYNNPDRVVPTRATSFNNSKMAFATKVRFAQTMIWEYEQLSDNYSSYDEYDDSDYLYSDDDDFYDEQRARARSS